MLYFDALMNNGNLTWSLTGPAGAVVTARSFTASDSFGSSSNNPVLNLPAGAYAVTITTSLATAQSYSFRLLDLAAGSPAIQPVTPGTAVSGELTVPNETDLYRFPATAGDQLFFDVVTVSDSGNSYLRLIDPVGGQVFSRGGLGDQDVLSLPFTGTYTLLVEGWIANSGTDTYALNVQPLTVDVAPVTLNSTTDFSSFSR